MHIIKRIQIEKFRAFHNLDIPLDRDIIAIAGQNGTQKTTLLGMLAQPFSLSAETAKLHGEKTIEGLNFCSQLKDKFKFAPPHDLPGEHVWTLTICQEIYAGQTFKCTSMLRSKDENSIRFWNANDKAHTKGKGFIHCPTIFLSLSRLYPWGEIKGEKQDGFKLSEEDISKYKEWHRNILVVKDEIKNVHTLQHGSKTSIGPETADYDPMAMSAGQDNIGKIILSVLSFRKLVKNPNYKGGIIFIDEFETALYPAAQFKLLEYMFKWASEYKLQFIFTTHSETVLNFLRTSKYQKEAAIVFLSRISENIKAEINLEWPQMKANLEITTVKKNLNFPPKIKVYAEDNMTFLFLKRILPKKYISKVALQEKISLGSGHYLELLRQKVPEFTSSIIVLDADTKSRKEFTKSKFKNVIFLPGEHICPELVLYKFLKGLKENDKFWDTYTGGYTYQVAIDKYEEINDSDKAKEWFDEQKENWGRGCSKPFKRFIELNPDYVETLKIDFIKAYNYLATKHGYNSIE
jgi:ABC-type iron transport system FetAB ATPase subunit